MRHVAAGQPISLLPPGSVHRVDAVSGCVMLIRRRVFEEAGLLDEAFFFSFEDIEFCLRARRAGFDVLSVSEAIAYHEGGRSIGRLSPDRVYYAARNHLRLVHMGNGSRPALLRGGLVVGLNAGYVLLSGETPRIRGFAALARGVWHHLNGRYGPA
jgi:GT2 family glycosyltransferase